MRVVDVEGGMADNSLVNFLSDPATLVSLGIIAAGTAYYLSTRPTPVKPPIPLDKQSIELPVSSEQSKFRSGGGEEWRNSNIDSVL